ncbi:cell agglutination protein Mam3 [Sporothrix epigloea]|uniref:Cell agglutination protein Mam3 n=1 Tax=Sporothrix epigloea TaxID=1892477 RepID=A0ABP0DUX2_9PEZI
MAPSLQHRQLGHNAPTPGGRVFGSTGTVRTLVLGLSRIISASLPVGAVSAAPLSALDALGKGKNGYWLFENSGADDADGASTLVLYVASVVLVLLGGAFAGLTIALMGQDSIYLQVLSRDDTDPQQKNAKRVGELLKRGKHWVLVTLLLSNVIVNETLPVVLDRCLGGGIAAVVGSTLLIVVFGEVLPQSICVRYGLQIGGIMAKPVLALMWLLAPIAWPTAKILDHALGEDHGTVYKKSGLKTLVTLHRSLGEVSERLNQDEVTIISAVLDLKEKPVSSVMTPMEDVFTMSEDTILDEKMMDMILSAGYSRIPIHEPYNPTNFVGMLLVKILITYDPDDKSRVSEFPLATLPETRPETSCLDIVNFFQEGKSHMVLVSQYPGEDHGALGVVTLEDVIEELIGEEIIDESDVYIDVHKAIRRLQPAPRARPTRHKSLATGFEATSSTAATNVADDDEVIVGDYDDDELPLGQQEIPVLRTLSKSDLNTGALSTSPKTTTVMMRRCSAGTDGRLTKSAVPVRANIDEMWQHLRHLGPSNRANNPKNTRSTTVKIKQGHSHAGHQALLEPVTVARSGRSNNEGDSDDDVDAGETTPLLVNVGSASQTNSQTNSRPTSQGYGTPSIIAKGPDAELLDAHDVDSSLPGTSEFLADEAVIGSSESESSKRNETQILSSMLDRGSRSVTGEGAAQSSSESSSSRSASLAAASDINTPPSRRSIVRSGSITENVIETHGIRKVVLETSSTAENDEEATQVMASSSYIVRHTPSSGPQSPKNHVTGATEKEEGTVKKKDLEKALLSAVQSETTAENAASALAPEVTPSGGQSDCVPADDSDAPATANGGGSGAKKKNRRKKRKAAK